MSKQAKRQLAGSGETLPAGVIGERYESVAAPAVAASNSGVTAGQISLPAGVWLIQVAGAVINSAGTITSGFFVAIPTTDSGLNPGDVNQGWGAVELGGYVQAYTLNAANTVRTSGSGSVIVNITTPATYYHRVAWSSTGGGTVGFRGYIRAIRIA